MLHGKITRTIVLIFCILFLGCVDHAPPVADKTLQKSKTAGYHRFDLGQAHSVDAAGYVQKVDNFTIVFDPSASMTESYMPSEDCITCHTDYQNPAYAEQHGVKHGGREFARKGDKVYTLDCSQCHQDYVYSKFDFAKELAKNFNQTIPDLNLKGTIRTFGFPVYTNFHYGLNEDDNTKILKHNKKEYGRALGKILEADGVSPLHLTLKAVGKDWFEKKGKIAVIIISDGKDMGKKDIFAAEDLKARYGENICIYTILIGSSPSGRRVMTKIALNGKCGIATNGDLLLDREKMDAFVRKVFLAEGKGSDDCRGDEDCDGVPDYRDDCPGGLIPGFQVNDKGCWNLVLTADVLFDFDKDMLKPEGITALEQVRDLLFRYRFLDLHISGHTDNFGSMEYNIDLSKRRAMAGYDYLKKQGIDEKRLSISWHSYKIPVASNDTAAGRALNRRLEFEFKKHQD